MDTQPNTQETVPCPICKRAFASMQALRMHHIRVHTAQGRKNWGAIHNSKKGLKGAWTKNQPHASFLETRRKYQRALREKYYSEGKDSRGFPRPAGYKPRKRPVPPSSTPEAKRAYYIAARDRFDHEINTLDAQFAATMLMIEPNVTL